MRFQNVETIYLMGVGGIAMGTLATLLVEKGYRVVGSDQNLYPPMSDHLQALGIPIHLGYAAENVASSKPDLVVVGNVIRRVNPEAAYVLEHGIPHVSMPEAIAELFLNTQKGVVVAGTHGKSTTSSLLAWIFAHAGLDPSAFVGAFMNNWGLGSRLGSGPYMVIEGDEYDTAFFDKGPKFLHYRPQIGLIGSIEFDHADIFKDFDAVFQAFARFVDIIPPEGHLVLNADDPHCMALADRCRGTVTTYGNAEGADWRIHDITPLSSAVKFTCTHAPSGNVLTIHSPIPGDHNVQNAVAALAVSTLAGIGPEAFQAALLEFKGVRRRQQELGEVGGILVVDDFAHHPTAVKVTIEAMRRFHPERRLIAAFEPRTNSSRRNVFQKAYAGAFDAADMVCIKKPAGLEAIPEEERMDTRKLVADVSSRGIEAHHFDDVDAMVGFLTRFCRPGDQVLCMSNGSFDGFQKKLLAALTMHG